MFRGFTSERIATKIAKKEKNVFLSDTAGKCVFFKSYIRGSPTECLHSMKENLVLTRKKARKKDNFYW